MKIPLLCILGLLTCVGPAVAAGSASSYSQTYAILIKGSLAGTENVKEESDRNGNLVSTSDHEITITDGLETKHMAFTTTMILSKGTLAPIHYTYQYTSGDSGDSYDVTVKDNQITRILRRGGRTSEVTELMQPGMVILDFNVYHQYDYLVRKYDNKKRGRQSFSNFLPLIGSNVPIALTFLGNSNLEYIKDIIAARSFRIEFVGIWTGTLWVDTEGRLVRLQIPDQDLEVLRKDLLPEAQKPTP